MTESIGKMATFGFVSLRSTLIGQFLTTKKLLFSMTRQHLHQVIMMLSAAFASSHGLTSHPVVILSVGHAYRS